MAFYSNGTDTVYCPWDNVAEKLIENGWTEISAPAPNTDFAFSVDDLTDKIVSIKSYVNTFTYGLSADNKWKIVPSNIRNGIEILGVTGTMLPYVAPEGVVKAEYTSNGTYIVDCSNKAQVEIKINVPTVSGGAEEEDDEEIMTIIPCKVVLDSIQAIQSVHLKSSTYADLSTVKDSNKPYAVKVKADIYCDLTVAGLGVLFVESMYLNLSSYNSSAFAEIDYAVFEGNTANTTTAFNPMQFTINCDENASTLLWMHLVNGTLTAEEVDATFDLEA